MPNNSRREIAATTLGQSISDLKDYQYHPGKTRIAMYSIGETMLCVGTKAEMITVAKYLHSDEFVPHEDSYCQRMANKSGWTVWRSNS